MMTLERIFPRRAKMAAMAILAGAAVVTIGGVIMPRPALAWWRGGVWVAGPGYYPYRPYYYGPRPYYYAPPPIYYAPPPVVYAPPPVYYPAPAATYPVVARTCYAPALNCPMEVPRSPGAACYCSDASGNRNYGTAH